ncbi:MULTISPECIES: DUF742 domain-containing protein [Thermomonospora]|uniref:DUF742 domain-containing protein n=1 Tax=Thermomonospora cellulosilytica TaxID=1411118 RepID=A0A7W3MXU1_9ACTN|nr:MULTISPECIES: DUF742 domain-containing protein [Thermomonospora]MBA9003905.1 hypothetical protein [Thermomonospora cellulosilytica]
MTGNPWLRPYVLTGGRTRTRRNLYMHTLVSAPDYDPAYASRLLPEARRLYERAHASAESVAELSAHCGVSLGVTRVLLGDLASAGRVLIHPETYDSPYDPRLLKEVIHGLRELA